MTTWDPVRCRYSRKEGLSVVAGVCDWSSRRHTDRVGKLPNRRNFEGLVPSKVAALVREIYYVENSDRPASRRPTDGRIQVRLSKLLT